MREHGTSGRAFAGRVLQVITGSSGLDDFEWGVTLFAVHPDDLKEVVYSCASTGRRPSTASSGASTPAWSPPSRSSSAAVDRTDALARPYDAQRA